MDYEKLYDYLKTAGKPLSIGQICGAPEFAGCSRREIAVGLQQLASENIAFRSVREGRAYYSANPAEGVSRNPCQQFISGMASNLNNAFAAAQNPELQQMGKMFQILNGLSEMLPEQPEKGTAVFSYDQGLVADCEKYSVAIPDGFRLEMGRDGRDFVAWLPSEDSEDPDEAQIVLYAGQQGVGTVDKLDPWLICPELMTALIQGTQWQMKTQTDRMLGVSEMQEIPCLGQVAGSYLYSNNNYQIMLGFPDGIKQMRVLVNEFGMTWQTYHKAVVDWIATMKLKRGFMELEPLNSEKYLPLNDDNFAKWDVLAAKWVQRISGILNMRNQTRVVQFRYEQNNGTASMTMLKKDIRQLAETSMTTFEEINREMVAFLKRAAAYDPTQTNLLKLRTILQNCQENLSMSFNLGEDKVEVTSAYRQELKAALDLPEIAVLLEQEEKRKTAEEAERKRVEAERRAAKEAERKRREEERRAEEERRRKEEEERRRAEEERRRAEEQRRQEEQARREEELRRIEEEARIEAEKTAALRRAEAEIIARERAERKRIKREKFLRRLKKTLITLLILAVLLGALAILTPTVILPAIENAMQYKTAQEYLENGWYDEAEAEFRSLGDYKDAYLLADEAKYQKAEALLEAQRYEEAIAVWKEIGGYSDSAVRAEKALEQWREPDYQAALDMMEQGSYQDAASLFATLDGYRNSEAKIEECNALYMENAYAKAQEVYASGAYVEAMELFEQLGTYEDSRQMYQTCAYAHGCALLEAKDYSNAILYLGMSNGYEDADPLIKDATYQYGLQLLQEQRYSDAIAQLRKCGDYKEAVKKVKDAKMGYAKANLNRDDSNTRTYLKDLIADNYYGAQKLYDDLYAWKAEIVAFNNSPYDQTNQKTISKYQGMYCHFKVTGGEPGATINIKAVVTAPNGQSGSIFFNSSRDGNIWSTCFTYDNPYYGATGTMSVRIVDADTNRQLTSGSVRVTN